MARQGQQHIDLTSGSNNTFKANKDDLISLVSKCQQRTFAEELEQLEKIGGDQAFQDLLGVDFKKGIDESEVQSRQAQYGTGEVEEEPPKGFFKIWLGALDDFTLKILLVAATVSIVANEIVEEDKSTAWIEGFAIFVAVFVCSFVASLNDYEKDKQFRKLKEVSGAQKEVNVWRNGQLKSISETKLVTGDVIKISEGMDIPVDMLLLSAHDVTVNESALTGEPDAVKKAAFKDCIKKREELGGGEHKAHDVPSPILMSGTSILTGEGKAVILLVGNASIIGQIRQYLVQEVEITPLQKKLEAVARDIGKFGLISGVLTLVLLFIRFIIDRAITNTWGEGSEYIILIRYVIIGIAVVAVAIPEGLPLSVTLSLAYSVKKMMKENNLVRKLYATETMGGANNICSDKTGTLTQNKMNLTAFWNGKVTEIDPYKKGQLSDVFPEKVHDLMRQALACNSSATLEPLHGSKTEIALLEFLQNYGEDFNAQRDKYDTQNAVKFPFSSQRKRMSTILENVEDASSKKRMHIKGASEIVLEACTELYSFEQDKKTEINEELKKKLEKEIENMANKGLRTICIGYKDISGSENLEAKDEKNVYEIEKTGFTLIGVLGIRDILREEVKGAIAQCKKAGIKVRMVTGDNKITAKAIAMECGIIDPKNQQSIVMTGPEFIERTGGVICKNCKTKDCDCPRDKETAKRTNKEVRVDTIQNAAEFDKIYKNLDVLARSRPEDKYALVTGLIERGCVVAVTGDGTNDAPALRKADVGFAMNSGTDVCKEAADIILLDDNFASIVKAAMWGRNIYDNIRRFLQFQLTVNIVAVGITLVSAAILKDSVLTAVQLLWVNLIMDTLASLALATEPPTEKLLDREPHDRNEYIVSRTMMKHILGQAIYQFSLVMILVFTGDKWIPEYLPHDPMPGYPGEEAYYSEVGGKFVRSGRPYMLSGTEEDYLRFYNIVGPSRHYSFIFSCFVYCQVFNFMNARKIHDEYNIFGGILKNKFFVVIVAGIAGLQLIIGNLGGLPFSISFHGLDVRQWAIAISIGAFSLVWSIILKAIPIEKLCPRFGKKKANPLKSDSAVLNWKRAKNKAVLYRRLTSKQIPERQGLKKAQSENDRLAAMSLKRSQTSDERPGLKRYQTTDIKDLQRPLLKSQVTL